MTRESLGELRERLLRDESVQQMIKARAFEIYQMRGHHHGGPADDWFQAESEVLAFLIADYPQRPDEKEAEHSGGKANIGESPQEAMEAKKSKSRTAVKSARAALPKKTTRKRANLKKTNETKPERRRARKGTKLEENG